MNCKLIYLAGLIICFSYIGCSSGEYEIREVKIDYTEKQLVYDTIRSTEKTGDTTSHNNNNVINNKKDNFSFIVQIGAYIDKFNFDNFYETAKANLGEGVYFLTLNNLYKIRIGNYNNKAEALKMLDYVKGLGYDDAFVITVKNK